MYFLQYFLLRLSPFSKHSHWIFSVLSNMFFIRSYWLILSRLLLGVQIWCYELGFAKKSGNVGLDILYQTDFSFLLLAWHYTIMASCWSKSPTYYFSWTYVISELPLSSPVFLNMAVGSCLNFWMSFWLLIIARTSRSKIPTAESPSHRPRDKVDIRTDLNQPKI